MRLWNAHTMHHQAAATSSTAAAGAAPMMASSGNSASPPSQAGGGGGGSPTASKGSGIGTCGGGGSGGPSAAAANKDASPLLPPPGPDSTSSPPASASSCCLTFAHHLSGSATLPDPVADVAWCPASSTLFATVTRGGWLQVRLHPAAGSAIALFLSHGCCASSDTSSFRVLVPSHVFLSCSCGRRSRPPPPCLRLK